jgi:hypothetical protein
MLQPHDTGDDNDNVTFLDWNAGRCELAGTVG